MNGKNKLKKEEKQGNELLNIAAHGQAAGHVGRHAAVVAAGTQRLQKGDDGLRGGHAGRKQRVALRQAHVRIGRAAATGAARPAAAGALKG